LPEAIAVESNQQGLFRSAGFRRCDFLSGDNDADAQIAEADWTGLLPAGGVAVFRLGSCPLRIEALVCTG